MVQNVRVMSSAARSSSLTRTTHIAHGDAVWGVRWTQSDSVVSISADGTIKTWDSTSGQVSHGLPAHTLGLVSVDTDSSGGKVVYNTLEGLTCLWDLGSGDVVGKFESYARSSDADAATEPSKSCRAPRLWTDRRSVDSIFRAQIYSSPQT